MKRAPTLDKPFTYGLSSDSSRLWRSMEEFVDSNAFKDAATREFPDGASVLEGASRREFMQLMGASVALAGLAGCRRPEEKILPYARRGDTVVEGKSIHFATAIPFYGTAVGLLVESHEGRPTKIEGNPQHPDAPGGGSTSYIQASVLDLYDPDRSQSPRQKERKATWDEAAAWLRERGASHKAKGGKGLAILTEAHRSPSLQAQLDELRKQQPEAKVVRWEAFSRWAGLEGARLAFGKAYEAVPAVAAAKVILSLDSDFLFNESSPVKNARGFADGRRITGDGKSASMNRLYVAESAFTVTGSSADHRLRLKSSEVHTLALAIAAACGVAVPAPGTLDDKKQKWVKAVAADLSANRGASLVFAGQKQPPAVHALAHLLNVQLGNVGKTVDYVKPFTEDAEGPKALAELVAAMGKGEVETLVILGGNPAFDAPSDVDFAGALGKVAHSVHLSTHVDDTSSLTGWHLNRAHFLEQWGDVRAEDGTASVVQPLIAPIYGGRSDAEVLELILGGQRTAYQIVQQTWQSQVALDFGKVWRKGLHTGLLDGTAFAKEAPASALDASKLAPAAIPAVEVTFAPDAHVYDGRFANSSWLLELPDPMTKVTWDNVALVSPATARKLGLSDGDTLTVTVAGKSATLGALVAPGQADDSIGLTLGFGRKQVGRVGLGTGVSTMALRPSTGTGLVEGTVAKAGGKFEIARTQEHHTMDAPMAGGRVHHRPLVRETSLTKFVQKPDFVQESEEPSAKHLFSLFPDYKYDGHRWSMVIDLGTCIGCSACLTACQAENNIPVVGKKGVIMSREMHWIRIDRYFSGDDENEPAAVMQPITCQHCENAPCEQVCPVGATTHSPEGLNDMAYNRCIGTRYCANNCPFKVRRFNFFNYNRDVPEIRRMQFNPEVTVRSRGVIEKCSYCVQRINKAKIAAHREGREYVKDGEVRTACQQACPAGAISFGNLNDAEAQVTKAAAQPRKYQLLTELNVRPRTQFLGRVRNPNPELV